MYYSISENIFFNKCNNKNKIKLFFSIFRDSNKCILYSINYAKLQANYNLKNKYYLKHLFGIYLFTNNKIYLREIEH